MKAIALSLYIFMCSGVVAHADAGGVRGANAAVVEPILVAEQLFAERDFSEDGIRKAQEAADIFGDLAEAATQPPTRAEYLVRQAEALGFVGEAMFDLTDKLSAHERGIAISSEAARILGISDISKFVESDLGHLRGTLSKDDTKTLCRGLYQYAFHLTKWGIASGIVTALTKWSEARKPLELILTLGHGEIYSYGPLRLLGRGYFKVPALLGGSVTRAESYLATAVRNSLASPDQVFSVEGENNLFYAEALKQTGQLEKAKGLLKAFVDADVTRLDPTRVQENARAQQEAETWLANW